METSNRNNHGDAFDVAQNIEFSSKLKTDSCVVTLTSDFAHDILNAITAVYDKYKLQYTDSDIAINIHDIENEIEYLHSDEDVEILKEAVEDDCEMSTSDLTCIINLVMSIRNKCSDTYKESIASNNDNRTTAYKLFYKDVCEHVVNVIHTYNSDARMLPDEDFNVSNIIACKALYKLPYQEFVKMFAFMIDTIS